MQTAGPMETSDQGAVVRVPFGSADPLILQAVIEQVRAQLAL
jgi:hypothetical protein